MYWYHHISPTSHTHPPTRTLSFMPCRSVIYVIIQSIIHWLNHSAIQPVTQLLTPSFIQLLTHPVTHSTSHSNIISLNWPHTQRGTISDSLTHSSSSKCGHDALSCFGGKKLCFFFSFLIMQMVSANKMISWFYQYGNMSSTRGCFKNWFMNWLRQSATYHPDNLIENNCGLWSEYAYRGCNVPLHDPACFSHQL